MSDFENMDVILGNDNINPVERELSCVNGNSENLCDTESNLQFRDKNPQGNVFGLYVHENIVHGQDKFQETMETFTCEFNMRLPGKVFHDIHDAHSDKESNNFSYSRKSHTRDTKHCKLYVLIRK